MQIKSLRTPEERFENLPDYPFAPNYATVKGDLRIHYLDINPNSKNVVLLLHGEPSWSFLYRKMIPTFSAENYRVIVPDLIGFGKSDKPIQMEDYTYQRHLNWIEELLFDQLDLKNIHMFVQDWGGLIGLRLLAKHSERFTTVTAGNTILPTGEQEPNEAFKKWQAYSKVANPFPVGNIIQNATTTDLSDEVVAGYNAPYPDESYKAGAKIFPSLVPTSKDDPASSDNKKAWGILSQLQIPFLTLFSDKDPIMKGLERVFQSVMPGAKGQPHSIIENGGHFLQEDQGEEIAKRMLDWMKSLS